MTQGETLVKAIAKINKARELWIETVYIALRIKVRTFFYLLLATYDPIIFIVLTYILYDYRSGKKAIPLPSRRI
jgi:hypothetical protein